MVMQPVLLRIQAEVPNLRANAWIQDDGNLVGDKSSLQQALAIIRSDGPPRGLFLRADKSLVFCPRHPQGDQFPLEPEIKRVSEGGVRVLGSPVGNAAFSKAFVEAKVDELEFLLGKLELLQDPHTQFALLRSCYSLPKLSYLTRTAPPASIMQSYQRFDQAVRQSLEALLGSSLTNTQWTQATLPVSQGGMGLRSAADHAPGAYLVSVLSSAKIIHEVTGVEVVEGGMEDGGPVRLPGGHIAAALPLLNHMVPEPHTVQTITDSSQKVISHTIDSHIHQQLATSMTEVRDKARLNSLGVPRSSDWLNTLPSKALGLHLKPLEFTTMVRYRLGLPVFQAEGPCPACGRHSDRLGDHALGCAQQGERIYRHNALRDIVFQSAQQACLSPTREERFLITERESERPGDVKIPNWISGQDCALDITVISPLQEARVRKAAEEAGSALEHRFNAKMTKSFDSCRAEGIHFLPLVVSTLGGWHPQAIKAITRLGKQLGRHTGRGEDETVRHLFQRLAISQAKTNATLILSRRQEHTAGEVDGDLDQNTN